MSQTLAQKSRPVFADVISVIFELSMIEVSEFPEPFLPGQDTITANCMLSGVVPLETDQVVVYTVFNPARIVVASDPGGPTLSDPPVIVSYEA